MADADDADCGHLHPPFAHAPATVPKHAQSSVCYRTRRSVRSLIHGEVDDQPRHSPLSTGMYSTTEWRLSQLASVTACACHRTITCCAARGLERRTAHVGRATDAQVSMEECKGLDLSPPCCTRKAVRTVSPRPSRQGIASPPRRSKEWKGLALPTPRSSRSAARRGVESSRASSPPEESLDWQPTILRGMPLHCAVLAKCTCAHTADRRRSRQVLEPNQSQIQERGM